MTGTAQLCRLFLPPKTECKSKISTFPGQNGLGMMELPLGMMELPLARQGSHSRGSFPNISWAEQSLGAQGEQGSPGRPRRCRREGSCSSSPSSATLFLLFPGAWNQPGFPSTLGAATAKKYLSPLSPSFWGLFLVTQSGFFLLFLFCTKLFARLYF